MKTRTWFRMCFIPLTLFSAVSLVEVRGQESKDSIDVLSDELLKTLGIERKLVQTNAELRTVLTDAVGKLDRKDGAGLLDELDKASGLDEMLPRGEVLLARLLVDIDAEKVERLFHQKTKTHLIQSFEQGSNVEYEASRTEKGAERRRRLESALIYSQALAKLQPQDDGYTFNVGYMYQELGNYDKARAIMDKLAPRDSNGFAKAHLWQADQLLSPDRPLNADSLDKAEAHLLRALPNYNPVEEVYRRLGELYFYRYVHYDSRSRDPRQPGKEIYLQKADQYLSKVVDSDAKLALTLAEIRSLQGKGEAARAEAEKVVERLQEKLKNVPDDVDARILLARAHRMLHRFADAANVLREGAVLRKDPIYEQELSNVYYYQAADIRNLKPDDLKAQFAALQAAYLAYPTNNFVVYRFVEALSSAAEKDVEAARTALQKLVDDDAPGQTAWFLLGVDRLWNKTPNDAKRYFERCRKQQPDGTSAVFASMSIAVFKDQLKNLNLVKYRILFEACFQVWPDDPDLLVARSYRHVQNVNFFDALADLQKALEKRPNDVKTLEMAAGVCDKLGRAAEATKYRERAEAARIK